MSRHFQKSAGFRGILTPTPRPPYTWLDPCGNPSLDLVGNNPPPPLFSNPGKTRGGYFLRMPIPQNFSRLRRDHDIQGLCYFYQLSTLITSDSAPQAKILRFSDSKMMISIAKSIENRFQISNFLLTPVGNNPPLVQNPGKTRGGGYFQGGGYFLLTRVIVFFLEKIAS